MHEGSDAAANDARPRSSISSDPTARTALQGKLEINNEHSYAYQNITFQFLSLEINILIKPRIHETTFTPCDAGDVYRKRQMQVTVVE